MRKLNQEQVDYTGAKASVAADAHGELALHAYEENRSGWSFEDEATKTACEIDVNTNMRHTKICWCY